MIFTWDAEKHMWILELYLEISKKILANIVQKTIFKLYIIENNETLTFLKLNLKNLISIFN